MRSLAKEANAQRATLRELKARLDDLHRRRLPEANAEYKLVEAEAQFLRLEKARLTVMGKNIDAIRSSPHVMQAIEQAREALVAERARSQRESRIVRAHWDALGAESEAVLEDIKAGTVRTFLADTRTREALRELVEILKPVCAPLLPGSTGVRLIEIVFSLW